jgi:hypothetical protein
VLRRRARHRHDNPTRLSATANRPRAVATLCVVALAAFAAGCGGGGSSGPDKQAFIDKANRVCAGASGALQLQISREFGKSGGATKEQLIQFTKTSAVPSLEAELKLLRSLPQPDEDSATLKSYYASFAGGIAALKKNPTLVVGKQVPADFKQADKLARAYGINACVRGV